MTSTTDKLESILKLFPLPGPGINPFDMSFPALARLHAGEPLTIVAYQTERERVRFMLMNRVNQIKQFSPKRAELALAVWDAWVRSGGSFTEAALLLKQRIGLTLSRQAFFHRIKSMMQAGIIPHHRSRKPARNSIMVAEMRRPGHPEADSVAISA